MTEQTPIFWSTPGAQDIVDFVWDTTVFQVTEPWPSMEPVTVRDAMTMVLGTPDVTARLYEIAEFRQMLALPEIVRCPHCGSSDCSDKWCGLRGDTQVIRTIEGEFHG